MTIIDADLHAVHASTAGAGGSRPIGVIHFSLIWGYMLGC